MVPMRTSPPFRADHVGSLLRPPALLRARDEFAAGHINAEQLREAEDVAITEAVAMQRDVGLRSATDGEFRRASWHMDFIYQIGGISKAPGNLAVRFYNPAGQIEFTPAALHVGGRLRMEKTIFGEDFEFLRSVVASQSPNAVLPRGDDRRSLDALAAAADAPQPPARVTPKLTIPSPNMVHYRGGPASLDPAVYPDAEEFWRDLSAAYADEVARLAALGCTYLQFDDTSLAYLNDPAQRAEIAARGEDADHLHLRYIRQVNDALAAKPKGLTVTTHMCRGNFRSSWAASGGYDFVAEALFTGLNVDGFFLEYDDERSGTFAPLRFVPPGKMVVLGLVTTKRGQLEDPGTLKRRIEEASRYVPLDQLCLSPQCGFSSTVEGNALTYPEEVAKLELIVKVARDVWG
jgi:5-methyltetrahydropteroyltriglutamate--homocysteine methyltransferase